MLRRIVLGTVVAIVLVGAANLLAEEKGERPEAGAGERMEAVPQRPEGFRPGQNQPPPRRMLGDWLEELTTAYQENDRTKMGQLLGDMSERRQRLQRGSGSPGRGMRPGQGQPMPSRRGGSSIESKPIPKTDAEKKILEVLEDMFQNQRRGMMNVSPADGRLLRVLTEAAGAKHVVEIGTSNGYSGIWFCLALRTTGGKLTTYEINARRASLARENFKRAAVADIVTLVEGNAHETVKKIKEPIDILFLDADKSGYIDYLNKLLPLVRAGGLILAHNTNMGMQDYIEAITTNPDLETIFLHKQAAGVGVTLKKR